MPVTRRMGRTIRSVAALTASLMIVDLCTVSAARATGVAGGLDSGSYALTAPAESSGGYGIAVSAGSAVLFEQAQPCQLLLKNGASEVDIAAGYSSVSVDGAALTGSCTVRTANGSAFRFADRYEPQDATGAFRLGRTVTVEVASPADEGFGTRFALGPQRAGTMDDYRFFSPAVWYDHNAYAAQNAIASDYRDSYFYYRETRAALPFTMMQDPASGATLSLAHADAESASSGSSDENGTDWQVSDALRYASIGAQRLPRPMLAVVYPGTEGNRVYGAPAGTAWRRRSNPVRVGFQQGYQLVIRAGQSGDFAPAVRDTWRYFFDLFDPAVNAAPEADVYGAGIDLLKSYLKQGSGRGLPFRTALPDGVPAPSDWNYLMGYVGEQIPAAYELLRYGIEHADPEATSLGGNVLTFWAERSLTPTGLPATWYDEAANGGFRNDPRYWQNPLPIYLRHLSDGMEKLVEAARFMREHGQPKPMWENLCTVYGNWLLRNQNGDGSFYRAYGYDGSAAVTSTFNTTNPIRFLTGLYFFTGDSRYLDSARLAGDYSLAHVSQPYHYAGGTADGEAVAIDREAGVQALHAYLSLYDATRDQKWLAGAGAAADYTETWMYAWNFQVKPLTAAPWQQRAAALGTTGLGFVGTGLSAVDTFLSYGTLDYYRLYLLTGDQHYLRVARLLAGNTKQSTELNGNLGYAKPGLAEEATGVADFVHGYTNPAEQKSYWLPWVTVAEVEPYADLRDMFGSMSLDEIEQRPLAERQRINNTYPARGPRYGGGVTDVANGGFEMPGAYTTGGIVPGWRTWTSDGGGSADAAFTESAGASHSGRWHLALWKKTPFALSAYQDLPLTNGTYRVTAWVESTGGFRASQLELHNFDTPDRFLRAPLPVATTAYRQVSLTVTVTTGLLTIGFWADDPTGTHWDRVDDVQVTRVAGS